MFINNLKEKLENSERINELKPLDTLKKIGIERNYNIADIGAGTGIFTMAASSLTDNKVYAIDKNISLLNFIEEKYKKEKIENIKTLLVDNFNYDIKTNSIDIVLLVTVLHEIEDKANLFLEINRILKDLGKLVIIEIIREKDDIKHPRITPEELENICNNFSYVKKDFFMLSEKFYCSVFSKNE